jgi:hypothetical protein
MSGILRRTAFVDQENGLWRFHDFCVVQTGLGTMVEFDAPFQRTQVQETNAYNPADAGSRVDKVESLSMDKRPALFKDGEIMLHEASYYKEGY